MTKERRILLLVAVVALVVAAPLLYRRAMPPPIKDVIGLGVVGEVAAEETARLVGDKGRVVMISFDSHGTSGRGFELVSRAFETRIGRINGIQVVAKEVLLLAGDTVSQQAAELVRKQTGANAIVILGGMPNLQIEDFAKLPRPLPKIVAVLAFSAEQTKRGLDDKIISLAIANLLYPPPPPDSPHPESTLRDLFDASFVVVTAANVNVLLPRVSTADSEQ